MCSVRSVSRIRAISSLPAAPPNRHNVAPVACSENIEKFAPALSRRGAKRILHAGQSYEFGFRHLDRATNGKRE